VLPSKSGEIDDQTLRIPPTVNYGCQRHYRADGFRRQRHMGFSEQKANLKQKRQPHQHCHDPIGPGLGNRVPPPQKTGGCGQAKQGQFHPTGSGRHQLNVH